jgi:hypothetical protein
MEDILEMQVMNISRNQLKQSPKKQQQKMVKREVQEYKDFFERRIKELAEERKHFVNELEVVQNNKNKKAIISFGSYENLEQFIESHKKTIKNIDDNLKYMTECVKAIDSFVLSIDDNLLLSALDEKMKVLLEQFATYYKQHYFFSKFHTIHWNHGMTHIIADVSIWDSSIVKSQVRSATDLNIGRILSMDINPKKSTVSMGHLYKNMTENTTFALNGLNHKGDKIESVNITLHHGKERGTFKKIDPVKVHSVSFLTLLLQEKEEDIQNQIESFRLSPEEKRYVEFMKNIPKRDILSIKRSGDWGQAEYCLKNGIFFISFDILALFYAYYRGCGQMCVHNKDSQFYGVRFQQEQIKLVDYALQMTSKLR